MRPLAAILLGGLLAQAPAAPVTPAPAADERYTFRSVRDFETEHVDRVFDALGVRDGAVIADWGAGGGRFTLAIAPNVGETGRVLAIDINRRMINRMRTSVESGATPGTVEPILCPPEGPDLADHSLDGVLMVDTYHEIEPLAAAMAKVRAALKPGGRLVVVDKWRASAAEQSRGVQVERHVLNVETAKQEIIGFGFRILEVAPDMFRVERDESLPVWMIVAELVPAGEQ